MQRNIENEYPYGQFPYKHTKNGQKEYFESLTHKNEQTVVSESISESQSQQQINQNGNSFDISKLLPLIKLMSNKKSISTSDMLQFVLPMMGGNMSQMADVMNLFNKEQIVEENPEDIEISPSIKIDEYEKIE